MSTSICKKPVYDQGLCRCCDSKKKCRLLNFEYEWIGQKEVYSDMFLDTFGLVLSHLDGEPEQRLICATCVSRLREASAFRRQVLACEAQLLKTQIHVDVTGVEIKEEKSDDELKGETEDLPESNHNDIQGAQGNQGDQGDQGDRVSHDDRDMDQDDIMEPDNDSDNEPLAKVKTETTSKVKKERKSRVTKKSKSEKSKRVSEKEKDRVKKLMIAALDMEDDDSFERYSEMKAEQKPQPKPRNTDKRILHNTATIVENSYVCPFDTSFSDYFCVYCRESFTDCEKLRKHTLNHDPIGYKDKVQNKKFLQVDILRIDCRLCNTNIPDLNTLKDHLITAHGKYLYPMKNEFLTFKLTNTTLNCLECDTDFSFFHALKKHMAEHFGTCICDVCGAHYFDERMLSLHQKTHQKVDEIFPCEACGKTFKSKHTRYLHIAKAHRKEPAYQCPKCDEVLFSSSLRYRHMKEAHGDQRLFQCARCDRTYDSRKSLREHNRRKHLKVFKHQCDICDKRFYIPSRLKEHLATHTGERNFRCSWCGKTYPRLRGLKVHMVSHGEEKRLRCSQCGAAFAQLAGLRAHTKRMHHDATASAP